MRHEFVCSETSTESFMAFSERRITLNCSNRTTKKGNVTPFAQFHYTERELALIQAMSTVDGSNYMSRSVAFH